MIYIDDLLGVPYKENGRDLNGFDCIGLYIESQKRLGHCIPDLQAYWLKNSVDNFELLANEAVKNIKGLKQVESPSQEGDTLLFLSPKGALHHIGTYLGNNQFIHCNLYGVHLDRLSRYPEKVGRVYTWQ